MRRTEARSLPEHLQARFTALGADGPGGRPLIVALSGGLDSCALLHAVRFGPGPSMSLVAAHFDHGMRPGSAADADWVAGLCRAWDVPLVVGRAQTALASEAEARDARYAFLESVRRERDGWAVATAHHADDQAETVLFRALRGTGVAGLEGIAERREPGVVRPLLEVGREELEAYASRHRIGWREDPTNASLGYARNVIRRVLLPMAEAEVAPGARRALARLARHAAEEAAAWRRALPLVVGGLDVVREAPHGRAAAGERGSEASGALDLSREALLALGPELGARALRALCADMGHGLDERATRRALDFAHSGASGRAVELGGGVTLGRALDRLRLVRRVGGLTVAGPADGRAPDALTIDDDGPGTGSVVLGGRPLVCAWEPWSGVGHAAAAVDSGFEATFARGGIDYPLTVRGRLPGDDIHTAGVTKKLKKLLLEARIPSHRRAAVPVVADRRGRVLWVPGVARTDEVAAVGPGGALRVRIDG